MLSNTHPSPRRVVPNRFAPISAAGFTRRGFLKIGGLAAGGLALPKLSLAGAAATGERARKAVIMVFPPGGPSHIDFLDPKPDAPADIRGPFSAIRTNVPGIEIC